MGRAVSCRGEKGRLTADALVDPPRATRVIPAEEWFVELFRDSAPALGRLLRATANTSTAAKRPRNAGAAD